MVGRDNNTVCSNANIIADCQSASAIQDGVGVDAAIRANGYWTAKRSEQDALSEIAVPTDGNGLIAWIDVCI
jgi:hypothetical protein